VDSSKLKDRTDVVRRRCGLLNAVSSLLQPMRSTISRALRSRRLNALLEMLGGGGGGGSRLRLYVYTVKG
jgi:hypothetical protein